MSLAHFGVGIDGVDGQADDFRPAFVEFGLQIGHGAKFGRANRRKSLGWENNTAQESPIHS